VPDRPTIALVAHGVHEHGGMERAFYELVRQAHDRYRFVVIASELDERLRGDVEWQRIRVPMRPISLKLVVFWLLAGLRLARTRATLVHTMGALVPNRADVATVQFCAAGFHERTGRFSSPGRTPLRRLNSAIVGLLGRAFETWSYRSGRLRVASAVSRGVAREVERHYPSVPLAITPNGVDLSRFVPDAAARAALRAEHGVRDDELVCMFVGNDWEHKGLAIAIDALAASGVDGRLWVVGRGDVARYGARARELGVEVLFAGSRTDVERWLAAADVFVFPTLYETFSNAAYEAAAVGLPVVATRVSGIDELLEGGRAGILVERDAASVAAALRTLAGDPTLRARLGAEGRRRTSSFDWSESVESVLRVYEDLVS